MSLLWCCTPNKVTLESTISNYLQIQAENSAKNLRIDTLIVISQNAISTIEVMQQELMFLRRFNTNLKETIGLHKELKNLLEEELSELDNMHSVKKSEGGIMDLQRQIYQCDSTINLYQPQLMKNDSDIKNIIANIDLIESDQLLYNETIYYIEGLAGNKVLSDTVVTYISKDRSSVVSFTNVLY